MLKTEEQAGRRPQEALLLENRTLAPGYHRLTFSAPGIIAGALAGQFVMIYMRQEHGYMLPRPFSIYGVDKARGELKIILEVKGRGTELLAGAGEGSTWKLLGPLGNGFPPLRPGSLLVAGGIGVAPLAFLASASAVPAVLIYGCRTADRFACLPADLARPGLELLEVTDDGSRGERGSAADLLACRLSGAAAVFACGPRPMLAAVAALCRKEGVEAWFSMEERMACGIGACLGCAVQSGGGYKRVCRDGPVFAAGEVFGL